MSLLARRRSSQKVVEAIERPSNLEDPLIPVLKIPDDYDPRIRGKGVHDFSAPRSARSSHSPPKSSSGQETHSKENQWSQKYRMAPPWGDDAPSSTEKQHIPVFKEHFDDDADSWHEGREEPAKRQKSSFMYQVALQESYTEPDSSALPAFARGLPASFPTSDTEPTPRVSSPPRAPLEAVLETAVSDNMSKEPSVVPSPPTSPRSKGRSRASSDTDTSFVPAGLPKHLKSNASRFSFDLAGVGSAAQEKLLEEKHRQKAKEKARASAESYNMEPRDDIDDDDMDLDLDDLGDDNDFEEKIPGVNADAEEDEILFSMSTMPAMTINSALLSKGAYVNTMSPVTEGFSPTSPQAGGSQAIASLISQASSNLSKDEGLTSSHRSPDEEPRPQDEPQNTVRSDLVAKSYALSEKPPDATLPMRPATAGLQVDDDMYFDDGLIEDFEEGDGQAFDESVFDDETSRVYGMPIRDLPKENQFRMAKGAFGGPSQPDNVASKGQFLSAEEEPGDHADDTITEEMRDLLPDLSQNPRPVFSHTAGLTQDNLAAYHDALAMAANQAALNGKFARRMSLQSEQSNEQPGLDSDPHHPAVGESPSLEINGYPLGQELPGSDDYDFDDAESDDPIIAAANAEALENDDEDFYGQEFGFYARSRTGSGEYANGGFFGPGVQRTHSGRNAEPALTPITERSEWSNRNSAVSLALHGYSSVSLPPPTPGLSQLADMMHLEEDNMSLSALMKLRRGAWGGSSTTSLQSSSGTSGSPLTYLPPMPSNAAAFQYQQQNQNNPPLLNTQNLGAASTYSLNSSNQSYSADDSPIASEGSQTLTLPRITIPPLTNPLPHRASSYSNSGSESSPTEPQSHVARVRPKSGLNPGSGKGGHSRSGSKDGESVCYVHETDEEGGRWVLEKRRIGEGGVVEVLGREVVEGGRI